MLVLNCINTELGPLVQSYPLIAGEIGQSSCAVNLINPVIDWLESKSQHFLAWQWVTASCDGSDAEGNYYGLITNYGTGAPTAGYGQGYKDRLAALVQPTATATATPTRTSTATSTPTRTVTPTSTLVPGAPTATPTPLPPVCAPPPSVSVAAVPNGDGRLRVTLTTTTNPASAPNLLQSLQFTRFDNAAIDIGSQTGVTGTFNVLPAVQSLTLFVRRAAPGAASTVEVTVRDGCGTWPTFVGGGPSAF